MLKLVIWMIFDFFGKLKKNKQILKFGAFGETKICIWKLFFKMGFIDLHTKDTFNASENII